jgi:hypothetical protein
LNSSLHCDTESWHAPTSYSTRRRAIPVQHCDSERVALALDGAGATLHLYGAVAAPSPSAAALPVHTLPALDIPMVIHAAEDWAQARTLCSEHVGGRALLIGVPDLSNLYHTLFDLLTPAWDSMLLGSGDDHHGKDLGAAAVRIVAMHSPQLTRAQPWLDPLLEGSSGGEFFRDNALLAPAESALMGDRDPCRFEEGLGRNGCESGVYSHLPVRCALNMYGSYREGCARV